jgi:hypothetical protein
VTRFLLCVASVTAALGASAWVSDAQPASACPGSDRHAVASTRPGATRELVPPGARAVLLCRYSGTYDGIGKRLPAFRLQARDLIESGATASSMTRELDSLPRFTAPIACPAEFGAAIVAFFRYAAGPDDPVTIALDGCLGAGNGHVNRIAESATGYDFVKHLAALTGLPHWA